MSDNREPVIIKVRGGNYGHDGQELGSYSNLYLEFDMGRDGVFLVHVEDWVKGQRRLVVRERTMLDAVITPGASNSFTVQGRQD